ncbi:DUF6053 domain-containing protein [Lysobacter yananisis]|uniref:DUF6053 domain-containing protein n=1 Tax=Lysobacter yananisis TaxID=1003114 RepID=UPI003CE5A81B
MGGASAPTLLFQSTANRSKSIGPERPSHKTSRDRRNAVVGGASAPTLLFQNTANRSKSIGPERPSH